MLDGRKSFVNLGDVLSLRDKIIFKFKMKAFVSFPSGEGRLLPVADLRDGPGVCNWGGTESVHERDDGHKFAGHTAAPVLA